MVATLDVLRGEVGDLPVVAARVPWAHATLGMLLIPGGYLADPPGREGVAHLSEHISIAATAPRHGVRILARTDATSTCFLLRTAPERADDLVEAVGSLFSPARHDRQVHESETNAVLIELARLVDQPQLAVAGAVALRSFPGLDLSVPDTATAESVRALTPEEVWEFRRATHVPERAVLVLVGPTEPGTLLDLLGQRLPVRPAASAPSRQAGEPPARRWAPPHLGSSCALAFAALTPPARCDEELAAREVAAELLAGSSGLLAQLAAEVGTQSTAFSVLSGRRHNLLVVGWPPGPAVTHLTERLREAMTALDPRAVSPALVAGARTRTVNRLSFDLQSLEALARMLLRHASGTGAWPDTSVFEAIPDALIAGWAVRTLRSARVWRIVDGALAEA